MTKKELTEQEIAAKLLMQSATRAGQQTKSVLELVGQTAIGLFQPPPPPRLEDSTAYAEVIQAVRTEVEQLEYQQRLVRNALDKLKEKIKQEQELTKLAQAELTRLQTYLSIEIID